MKPSIAIVGIACRLPGAKDYAHFWHNLKTGTNSIQEISDTRWKQSDYYSTQFNAPNKTLSKWCGLIDNIETFDAAYFGISARESKSMDPQQRLLLQETVHCIEDAAIPLRHLQTQRTGVYMGVMAIDYLIESTAPHIITDSYACLGNYECLLANRISYLFDLHGPSFSLDAACGSSLVAVHQARQALLAGEIDYALAGGVSLNLNPWKYIAFSKARMLSPDGQCKTFDVNANGYVPGEGVGVVLLQRLDDALRDNNHIYGVLRGSAVQHVGDSVSITAPSIEAQQRLIDEVLQQTGVSPETITYVEAHGTGTSLGDPIEVAALNQAFSHYTTQKQFCYLGSVKSNIGHLEAAAGVASLLKVLLMMRHRTIAPTLNVTQPNPLLFLADSAFKLPLQAEPWQPSASEEPLRAGISSFGFGGTMAHILVEAPPPRPASQPSFGRYPFLLSAKTPTALQHLQAQWQSLSQHPEFTQTALRDYAATLATGRQAHAYRWGCAVNTHRTLQAQLANPTQPRATASPTTWALGFADNNYTAQQLKPLYRQTRLLKARWQHLKQAIIASAHFAIDATTPVRYRDVTTTPAAQQFLSHYLYYASLLDLGFKPALIAGQGQGLWLSLALTELVPAVDILAMLNQGLAAEQLTFKIPRIALYDPVQQSPVSPIRFQQRYLRDLMNQLAVAEQDWTHYLAQARALANSQYTFKSYLNEWQAALSEQGLSLAHLLNENSTLTPAQITIQIVVIETALLKLYRKWQLTPNNRLANSYLKELTQLLASVELEKSLVVKLLLGNLHDFDTLLVILNNSHTDNFPVEQFPLLHQYNVLPSQFANVATWLSQALTATIPTDWAGDVAATVHVGEFAAAKPSTFTYAQPLPLLDTCLHLWQAGVDLDWSKYFAGQTFQKIPLPGYVFGGERYWLDAPSHSASTVAAPVASSPLPPTTSAAQTESLMNSLLTASSPQTQQWSRPLSPLTDAIIRDTVVEGVCITPSPLRLESALQAGQQVLGAQINCLTEVYFPNPGIIQQPVTLQVTVQADGQFQVLKQSSAPTDSELLAKGRAEARSLPKIATHTATAPITQQIESVALYQLFAQWGYHYGPGMQLIQRIAQTDNAFFIHIQAQPTTEGQATGLDPFVLDCMFQGVFYAGHLRGDLLQNRFLYVPISIQHLILHQALTTQCYAVIEYNALHITDSGDMRLSFQAYNADGQCALSVQNIYFRRVARDFLTVTPSLSMPAAATAATAPAVLAQLTAKTTAYLKTTIADALGQTAADIEDSTKLPSIGVDSLINQEIVERLGKVFAELPNTVLFEYSTVQQLTAYLLKHYESSLLDLFAVAVPSAPPESAPVAMGQNAVHQLSAHTRNYLKTVIADALGQATTDIEDSAKLPSIGVDSLINQEIVERLSKVFAELPNTILFEYSTVQQLTAYLLKHYTSTLHALLAVPTAATTTEHSAAQHTAPPSTAANSASISNTAAAHNAVTTEQGAPEPIAIIGCSGRFPQADSIDALWENLKQGKNSITEVPAERWAYQTFYDPNKGKGKSYTKWGGFLTGFDEFDPQFFGITPKQAQMMDPQQRIFLQAAWSSLEDAGYTHETLPQNSGVFVGVTTNNYSYWAAQQSPTDTPLCPDTDLYDVANRVSYFCDFQGPSMTVDTACSSSLSSVHLAVQSLRQKECRLAIAGGVSLTLHPQRVVQFCQKNMLSSEAYCHPFGEGKGGFVDAEGVGVIVLKPLAQAIQDRDHIYGIIRGTAINSGGHTGGYTVPNPRAQAHLVRTALDRACVSARSISYVEAHGTGTILGDPIEIEGLTQAFQTHTDDKQFCAIGSIKANIGHLIAAAGISGLIKILLQFKHRQLLPSIHSTPANPRIPFAKTPFYVQQTVSEWQADYPRRAGVSSFGVGGSNAHVVLEEYQPPPTTQPVSRSCLFVLSAKNPTRLMAYVERYIDFLTTPPAGLTLTTLTYTAQIGREAMAERLALVVDSIPQLLQSLQHIAAGQTPTAALAHYQGNREQHKKQQTLPPSDEAAIAALQSLLAQQALTELARLWCQGAAIDWAMLYANWPAEQLPRKCSLPTYPYAQQRYWLPDSTAAEAQDSAHTATVSIPSAQTNTAHPLLGKLAGWPSLKGEGLVFHSQLTANHWLFQDHQVNAQPVLPGVAYLELVWAAVQQIETAPLFMRELVWQQPLRLAQAQVPALQVVLHAVGQQLHFELRSHHTAAEPICHAYGQLSPLTQDPPAAIDWRAIQAGCEMELTAEAVYADFRQANLQYGPAFQGIEQVWKNAQEAVAILQLPAALQTHFSVYHYHPALMDAALQTALVLRDAPNIAMLPFMVETVLCYRPLLPRLIAYAKKRGPQQADVWLLDETGAVCVQFNNVVFQAAKDPLQDFFYTPAWHVAALPSASAPITTPSTILAFLPPATDARPAHAVITALQQQQPHAQLVALSETDFQAADYASIEQIYFLAALTEQTPPIHAFAELKAIQERTVQALHRVIKALAHSPHADRPLQLTVLTANIHALTAETPVSPWTAGLAGLTKAISREFPHWQVRRLAVTPAELLNGTLDLTALLAEPAHKDAEEVAWHQGQRYVRYLQRNPLPPVQQSPFRQQGVYVIAGGLGGVGQQLSEYLASQVQARLILLGRKPLDATRQAQIDAIIAQGGQVLYLPTDLTAWESVQAAIQQAKARFGAIHGVFNSAIVLQDKALENMSEAEFRQAYDTKALGSLYLAEAVAEEPLDFLIYFSSILSVIGNPGQGNYVAGGTFQDALAHYLRQQRPYPVQVVNWGYWGTVGIVANADYQQRMGKQGMTSIQPAEGMEAIKRMLVHQCEQVVAIKASPQLQERMLVVNEPVPAPTSNGLLTQLAATLNPPALVQPPLFRFQQGYAALNQFARQQLTQTFQQLGLTQGGAIPPRFQRFYAAAQRLLAQGQVSSETALTADTLAQQYPEIRLHLALLVHCLAHYPQLFREEILPTQVMFPNSSMEKVEGIYKNNPVSDYFNALAAHSTERFLAARCGQLAAGEKLRILEIGAGTGGTSASVLAAIQGYGAQLDYVYTDVSNFFLVHGKKHFAPAYPFMSFQLLDIGQDLAKQKYAPGSFDLVLATNVLHATPNIKTTLSNVHHLLAAGGWLVLNEMTAAQDLLTLTFGLLDGWWLYEDESYRIQDSPLLQPATWQQVFREVGFQASEVLGPAPAVGLNLAQNVLVAEKAAVTHTASRPQPAIQLPATQLTEEPAAAAPPAPQPAIPPATPVIAPAPIANAAADADGLEQQLLDFVLTGVAHASGLAFTEIDEDQPFSEYGIDSITGIDLINELNQTLNIGLSKTVLFDQSNVTALTAYIAAEYGDTLNLSSATTAEIIPTSSPAPLSPTIAATAGKPATEVVTNTLAAAPSEASEQQLLDTVLTGVANASGLSRDEIDEDQPFSEYGIDSITGIDLINELNQTLNIGLSKTALFDQTNVTALTAYIAAEYGDALDLTPTTAPTLATASQTVPTAMPNASTTASRIGPHCLHYGAAPEGDWQQGNAVTQHYHITVDNNNCIRDHVIYGQYIMPSDAYLEMLYIGTRKLLGYQTGLQVEHFNLQFPMITFPGSALECQLKLTPNAKGHRFAIQSRKAGSNDRYKVSVDGRFQAIDITPKVNPQFQTVWQQFSTEVLPSQIYTPEAILKVGPSYQTIQAIHIQGQTAVSQLRRSPDGERFRSQFVLEPSIVDGLFATGLYFASFLSGDMKNFFIPVQFDRIQVLRELHEEVYYGVVTAVSVKAEHISFNLALVDAQGVEVLTFQGFHLQKILAEDLKKNAQAPAEGAAVSTAAQPIQATQPKTPAPVTTTAHNRQDMQREHGMQIAVIGMAGRFPLADSVNEFWDNLAQGKDCVTEVPNARWSQSEHYDPDQSIPNKTYSKWGGFLKEIDRFDALFFQISGKESELSDPQQRIFLEDCWHTLEEAGYSDATLSGVKLGVFAGATKGDYQLKMHHEDQALIEGFSFPGNEPSVMAARISYILNLKGPSIAINTACSSSLVAINLACQSLLAGESDMALAGGIHVCVTPLFYKLTSKAGMLSPTGQCRAFDNDANGFVPGEASAAILLKPLDKALQDGDHIYGVIRGVGVNQDGKTNGMTAPSSVSQTALEASVYETYGVSPDSINYIETHGTGTKLGDPIEVSALTNAFRKFTEAKQFCPIGSVKTNIGHTAYAAGVSSVIKVLLSMQHQQLAPSLHCNQLNEYINFQDSPFYVNRELQAWTPANSQLRRAAVSSFGISGTNCHIVIDEPPALPPRVASTQARYLIPISAKSATAFQQKCQDLLNWLQGKGAAAELADIAYTLQVGRSHFAYRVAWLVSSRAELLAQLQTAVTPKRETASREVKKQGQQLVQQIQSSTFAEPVYSQQLAQLVTVYEQGFTPEWAGLTPASTARRIAMPLYPFERERFWIPQTAELTHVNAETLSATLATAAPSHLHPLLDRIDPRASLQAGLTYETRLEATHWLLQQHQVAGQAVLPGVAVLEMAHAAFALATTDPFHLTRVLWAKPVQVVAQQTVQLQLQRNTQTPRFTLQNVSGEVYAQGEFSRAASMPSASLMPQVNQVRQTATQHLTAAALYQQMQQLGVIHGAGLQTVQQIAFTAHNAVGELAVTPEWQARCADFTLSPALLDGCLQVGVAFLLNQAQPGSIRQLLPASVEKVDYWAAPDATALVYLEQIASHRFNLSLLNAQGEVCVRLSDVFYQVQPLHEMRHPSQADPLADFFYQPHWQTMPLPPATLNTVRQVLFLVPEHAAANALHRELSQAYQGIAQVEIRLSQRTQQLGPHCWQIDVQDPHALAQCLSGLPCPERIYFLGGMQAAIADSALTPNRLNHSQQVGAVSLLRLLQALIRQQWIHNSIELQVITENAQAIANPSPLNPFGASVLGLAKTAVKEYPQLAMRCLDVLAQEISSDLAAQLLAESTPAQGREVALRAGKRYILSLAPLTITPVSHTVLRQNGVYVILGGAGGIGFSFSRYLAETVQARVIWLGRRPADKAIQDKIAEIAAHGGQAVYLQADANELTSLQAVVAAVKQQFGAIHGVIHSALVLRDKALANMDETSFLAALTPKVQGSVHLYQAFASEPLDFALLFSSGESFTCYPGQSNYAAACTFKDAFAHYWQAQVNYPVKILNWGYWGTVGIVASASYNEQLAARGVFSIDPAEGMAAIERVLASDYGQVVPMKVTRAHLRELEIVLADELAPAPAVPSSNTVNTVRSATPPAAIVQPTTATNAEIYPAAEDFVKTVFAEALRLKKDQIDAQTTFDNYGMDSLIITSVLQAFEQRLGKLPVVTLYQHNTTESLTRYFIEQHHAALVQTLGSRLATITATATPPAVNPTAAPTTTQSVAASVEPFAQPIQPVQPVQQAPQAADIAIIGLSGKYPQAEDLAQFWDNLQQGINCVQEIPRERWDWQAYYSDNKHTLGTIYSKWGGFVSDVDKFDPLFFAIPPNEAHLMDPQERLFIETAWAVLEDAGYTRQALQPHSVGVFVGVMHADYEALAGESWSAQQYCAAHSSSWSMANRISYLLDFDGPSMAVNTACSSALTALHLAYENLLRGECDLAIAGGVNLILHPKHYLRLSAATMMSQDNQCKSFGADADGFVDGEGVGAVLLKPLAKAVADGDHIYAVIKASAMNAGGKTSGYTVPNPNAQAKVIQRALQQAQIDPLTINYVEAHGTGTAIGDPIEVTALTEAYHALGAQQAQYCALGSVKSNIGHLESAAGMAGLTKVLLQMQHRCLVPSLHAAHLNPHIAFTETPFYVQRQLSDWQPITLNGQQYPRRAGLSSFGAGGTNHHLIVEEYPQSAPLTQSVVTPLVFVLSAKTMERLQVYAQRLLNFLQQQPVDLLRLAYTLQQGREAMPARLAIVFSSQQALITELQQWLAQPTAHRSNLWSGTAQANTASQPLPLADYQQPHRLAQAWVSGLAVDWNPLMHNKGHAVQRLPLPTYPFLKETCWLPTATVAQTATIATPQVAKPGNGKGQTHKVVAVIGAGPAGLTAAKSLLEAGHVPIVFEKTDRIGGIWCFRDEYKGGGYQSTRLQTSKLTSLFSDFPPPDDMPLFPGVKDINRYLHAYSAHFGLMPYIQFATELERMTQDGEQWQLQLRQADGRQLTQQVDGVAICIGRLWQRKALTYPGLDSFQGEYLHAADYHAPDIFRNKRVLVIGNGVSGMDIAGDAVREAKQVWVSMRSKKMIIPRMFGFTTNDGSITSVKRLIINQQSATQILQEWQASIPTYMQDLTASGLLPSFPVKDNILLVNCDFPRLVRQGDIAIKPEVQQITAQQCLFQDGSAETVDFIVNCTGYNDPGYEFLPPSIDVNELYKHQFPPQHPNVAFFGRKNASLSVIPTLELEARWFAQVLAGHCNLPDVETMHQVIADDQHKESQRGQLFPTIDSSQQNMWLAEQIGAFPNPVTQWPLYWKLINLPTIPAIYRLVGPHRWEHAEAFLHRMQKKLYINRNDPRTEQVKIALLARLGRDNLQWMLQQGHITAAEFSQALGEPLPAEPSPDSVTLIEIPNTLLSTTAPTSPSTTQGEPA